MDKLSKDEISIILSNLDPESIVKVCSSSNHLRKMCNQYNFWKLAIGYFSILRRDELINILKYFTPQDVIIFCNTNLGFVNLCNKNRIWKPLVEYHYSSQNPDNIVDNISAREYYLNNTPFRFHYGYDPFGNNMIDNLGQNINLYDALSDFADLAEYEEHYYDDDGITSFVITGKQYINNDYVWINTFAWNRLLVGSPFNTKEEALHDIVYDIVDDEMKDAMDYVVDNFNYNVDNVENTKENQEYYLNIYNQLLKQYKYPEYKIFPGSGYYNTIQEYLDSLHLDKDQFTQTLYDYIYQNEFYVHRNLDCGDCRLNIYQVKKVKLNKNYLFL